MIIKLGRQIYRCPCVKPCQAGTGCTQEATRQEHSSLRLERLLRRGQEARRSIAVKPGLLPVPQLPRLLANGAVPAEIVHQKVGQRPAAQVVLAAELLAVGRGVDASAGGELLQHVPDERGGEARGGAVVQALCHPAEGDAGADEGEEAGAGVHEAAAQVGHPFPAAFLVGRGGVDGRRVAQGGVTLIGLLLLLRGCRCLLVLLLRRSLEPWRGVLVVVLRVRCRRRVLVLRPALSGRGARFVLVRHGWTGASSRWMDG